MDKIKIKIVIVGSLPFSLKETKIEKWKSDIFEVSGKIQHYELPTDSDLPNWVFSDKNLGEQVPTEFDERFLVAIVNVPLEENWYLRRLSGNRIVFTFYKMEEILRSRNIPLENIIYRLLYASSLAFKSHTNRIPEVSEIKNFTHDETRECLFDMNPNKYDVVYSCHKPIICQDCVARLRRRTVSLDEIRTSQKEIKKIRKILFYQIADWTKKHPIWAIIISSLYAILLGSIGSILGSFVYDLLK